MDSNEVPESAADAAKPFVDFKKPILIGKVGKLPRKIDSVKTDNTAKAETVKDEDANKSSDDKITEEKLERSRNEYRKIPKYSKPTGSAVTPGSTTDKALPMPYKEPKWSGLPPPDSGYKLQLLKNGSILQSIDLMARPYLVFGGLSIGNHIVMANPSISRYHAVLQYKAKVTDDGRPIGFYLYDLDSSHGSFVNKTRIQPNHYVRLRVGYLLKFGCSTRYFILEGPNEDMEAESELTMTEMKELREERIKKAKEELEAELAKRIEEVKQTVKKRLEEGVSWGMGEDAEEESDLSENPYAKAANEELYLDDPKKTLRGFFEREGLPLEYDCQERGTGQFVCKVELPIEDDRGNAVTAEVIHKGKKKDAVVQCALEACRIIDRHGLLRQAKHESRKRKTKDWKEEDYYDSDDDTFLDRTGAVESKREGRMQKVSGAAHSNTAPLTYAGLMDECRAAEKLIAAAEARLTDLRKTAAAKPEDTGTEEADALDSFMNSLNKQQGVSKAQISQTKLELLKLKASLAKTQRLAEIAKPADLPALAPTVDHSKEKTLAVKRLGNASIIVGKRIKLKNRQQTPFKVKNINAGGDSSERFEEEMDSDDDDDEKCVKGSKIDESESADVKKTCYNKDLKDFTKIGEGFKSVNFNDSDEKRVKGSNIDECDVKIDGNRCKDDSVKDKKAIKEGAVKKVFGPMRPPSNYVVPESYFEQENDRDLPEIMDEDV